MSLQVVIIGGGMIVHDQILPSLYHLQRLQVVDAIDICTTTTTRLRQLRGERFERAFPGQRFNAHPPLSEDPGRSFPDLYKQVVPAMAPHNLVIVATPDRLHHEMVKFALEHDQHVLCVKPLVQSYQHTCEIEQLARSKGLFVGVEYHKRFDRRSLEARESYRRGRFGEFQCGEAKLIEPYLYRHSNFQNWFTTDQADAFTYIGCHYVDLVYFITGLRPTEVAVRGVERAFPNGKVGHLWTAAQVIFENGAILSVLNGLGYPNEGPGTNDQGMVLFCEGPDCGAMIKHNDQFRGVTHAYTDREAGAAARFINPDYFRMVPWMSAGLRPVGYGYESIEANVFAVVDLMAASTKVSDELALSRRQELLERIDRKGLIATAANSSINDLVVEAARLSIGQQGQPVCIDLGEAAGVRVRG